MALVRIVTLTSVSSDGRIILIGDVTGNYNSSTNLTGYGAPNPAISSFTKLFVLGTYIDGTQVVLTSSDSGVTQTFLNGGTVGLNSSMSPGSTGSFTFRDGVLKISTYAQQASITIVGYGGDNFITGADLSTIATAGYVVTPDNKVYQVDSANAANTSTTLYLKSTLISDVTAGTPAFYAGTYAMVEAEFICKLTNAIAAMAGKNGDEGDKSGILADMLVKKFNADFSFAASDYESADFSIRTGITRLNRLLHG